MSPDLPLESPKRPNGREEALPNPSPATGNELPAQRSASRCLQPSLLPHPRSSIGSGWHRQKERSGFQLRHMQRPRVVIVDLPLKPPLLLKALLFFFSAQLSQ